MEIFNFQFSIFKKNRGGFTLLETVVALAILLVAVVGPAYLVTKSIGTVPSTKNKLIAANLAQEGLELVRLIRDNNALCILSGDGSGKWDWDADPSTEKPVNPDAIISGTYRISALETKSLKGNTNQNSCGQNSAKESPVLNLAWDTLLKFDPDDGYNYSTGNDTIFKRKVQIVSGRDTGINPDANDPWDNNPPDNIPIDAQMDVLVTVTWNEPSGTKSFKLKERLYNWQ